MKALGKAHFPVLVSAEIYRVPGYPKSHPLAISRIGPVIDICRRLGWLTPDNYRDSPVATPAELAAFHAPDYVAAVREVSRSGQVSPEQRLGFHLGTMENPVFPGLYQRAATSVGGSMLAARLALEGRIAYHPAGGTHHGRPDRAAGFCYFNDPVFAILTLLQGDAGRVAYVDLDAHHGDGVEDAFAAESRVLCLSVHEAGRWPGSGQSHGARARNFPVPRNYGSASFRALIRDRALPELSAFAPDAVVITCGADALRGDPLSSLGLANTALWDAVIAVAALAPAAVVLGGGGYNPWTTVRCWAGLWGRLNGFAMPAQLPQDLQQLLAAFTCDLVDDEDRAAHWLTTLADPEESDT
jgi:acetoin utilization protein AcuC